MKGEIRVGATSIANRKGMWGEISLGFRLYMAQDAEVDGVNNVIGPELPVAFGPESVAIPGSSFEASGTTREGSEFELTTLREEEAIQMRWFHFMIAPAWAAGFWSRKSEGGVVHPKPRSVQQKGRWKKHNGGQRRRQSHGSPL